MPFPSHRHNLLYYYHLYRRHSLCCRAIFLYSSAPPPSNPSSFPYLSTKHINTNNSPSRPYNFSLFHCIRALKSLYSTQPMLLLLVSSIYLHTIGNVNSNTITTTMRESIYFIYYYILFVAICTPTYTHCIHRQVHMKSDSRIEVVCALLVFFFFLLMQNYGRGWPTVAYLKKKIDVK